MNDTAWSISGADGQTILGHTHEPETESCGVLVICHGFKGYKDYGFFPFLAASAAKRSLTAHRFNFSHSGMTNDIETFERPDLFEADTWGKQVDDLKAVVDAIETGVLQGSSLPLVLFGHSRGAVTSLLFASRQLVEMAAVVAAASPHQACFLDEDQKKQLRQHGFLESPSSRTGQDLRLGRVWLDEIEADPSTWDPLRAVDSIPCPILLIHGDDDQTVHITSAQTLAHAAGEKATLSVIEGASHTFNAPNPLPLNETPPQETQRLVDLTCDFALQCCSVRP